VKKKKGVPLKEALDAVSLALFESWGKYLAKKLELDVAIKKAGISEHPVIYTSRVLFLTLLVGGTISIPILTLVATYPMGLIPKIVGSLIAIIIPIITVSIGLSYPNMIASTRKMMVENELPFFMSYIATMARGGVSVDNIIERVAELKIFKYLKEEANRMKMRMKYFGDDPLTAVERVVKGHPSTKFRDILLGYTTTLRTGGDIVHYLEIRTQELFVSRMNELRMIIERLGGFLEVYIVLGVIASITIFVFFAVTGALSTGAQAEATGEALRIPKMDLTTPILYNFIALPLMGIMVLFMIHVSQPKTPITQKGPYMVFLLMLPFAIIVFILTLYSLGGGDLLRGIIGIKETKAALVATTLAALVASVPSWITYSKEMRGSKGLIKSTADFLRDLSEVRKTGLSPEKCIISLAHRDYRNLSPIVKRVATALALGMSLELALKKALKGIREWFVLAVFRFLTDSISVGGGSPEIIDSLARFTQNLAEVEEEMRRRLRSYIALPYFGVVMIASSPIIILWLLTSGAQEVDPNVLAPLILVLSSGAIINSYVMGLVAGKVSQMSIAAGFKHSAIMTTLTTVTTLVTLAFLGI
jgi:flagellar protein FlaJ